MLLASPAGLLALALLSQSPTPSGQECEEASPRIELSASAPLAPPVVCLSPGLSTTLRFDSPLMPRSVKLEERERFEDVVAGTKNLLLVPPDNFVAGRRLALEVCFADGLAPACAPFLLVVHPGLGMQEVKVSRQPRPVSDFQQEAREAQAEVQRCQAEVQQLRAGREGPDGLRGVLASGVVKVGKGIGAKTLTADVTRKQGNALRAREVFSYRSEGRVAVEVLLDNPGTKPWTAGGAVLRGEKAEVLRPLPLWPPEPIAPAESGRDESTGGRVVVEVLAPPGTARGMYTLTLWDTEAQRPITLGNVTFP